MRNCSFNLFGINSNMYAWEKKKWVCGKSCYFHYFCIGWENRNRDNGSYFLYGNISLSYFAQVYFPEGSIPMLHPVKQVTCSCYRVLQSRTRLWKFWDKFNTFTAYVHENIESISSEIPAVWSRKQFLYCLLTISMKSQIENLIYKKSRSCSLQKLVLYVACTFQTLGNELLQIYSVRMG